MFNNNWSFLQGLEDRMIVVLSLNTYKVKYPT